MSQETHFYSEYACLDQIICIAVMCVLQSKFMSQKQYRCIVMEFQIHYQIIQFVATAFVIFVLCLLIII